jgi:hypothetical protein
MSETKNLPKIQDLYNDKVTLSKYNDLNILLNQEPKESWIKENNKIRYIPIERVEWLLTNIFIKWHVEIIETKLIVNAINITVKVHYKNPIDGEMEWTDGTGASPLQTKKGASASDLSQVNTYAVSMASPAAESFAIKDACEKLGKLFGKDLNRADEILYNSLNGKFEEPIDMGALLSEVISLIDKLPEENQVLYKDMLKNKKESGELSINIIKNIKLKVESELS